jgi:Fascin domain
MNISFRTVNGFYLCAEGGGGDLVMADRTGVGPWEEWVPVLQEDNTYALMTHDGVHFLTAVSDGTVEAKATEVNDWERFALEIRGASVAFKTAHGSYLQAPLGGGPGIRLVHAAGAHMPGEWEFFTPSEEFWDTTPQNLRPFFGPLRVQDKLFYDDNGPRRVLFCSWFPALRILRDSPEEFYRQLDSITEAGYQGIRTFLCVGGWDDYWNGREVAPVTFVKWFFTGSH